jgi:hypothetical protein
MAAPLSATVLSGSEWLDASASDTGSSITGVQFVVSSANVSDEVIGNGASTSYGYVFDWDTTTVPDGTYIVQSVTTDAAGNSVMSPGGVWVTVQNNPAPTIRALVPSSGASVAGTSVALDASASAPFGISTVQFEISGGSLQNDVIATGSPTPYGYVASWNSQSVPDGTYVLQSLAYDNEANQTVSAGVTINVTN